MTYVVCLYAQEKLPGQLGLINNIHAFRMIWTGMLQLSDAIQTADSSGVVHDHMTMHLVRLEQGSKRSAPF